VPIHARELALADAPAVVPVHARDHVLAAATGRAKAAVRVLAKEDAQVRARDLVPLLARPDARASISGNRIASYRGIRLPKTKTLSVVQAAGETSFRSITFPLYAAQESALQSNGKI
jgi:hypothetical protein